MRLDEISMAKFFTKAAGVSKEPKSIADTRGMISLEMRKLIDKHFPGSNAMVKGGGKSGFLFDDGVRGDFSNITIKFIQSDAGPLTANVEVYFNAKQRGDMKSPPIKRVKYTVRSEADIEQIKKDYPKQ